MGLFVVANLGVSLLSLSLSSDGDHPPPVLFTLLVTLYLDEFSGFLCVCLSLSLEGTGEGSEGMPLALSSRQWHTPTHRKDKGCCVGEEKQLPLSSLSTF